MTSTENTASSPCQDTQAASGPENIRSPTDPQDKSSSASNVHADTGKTLLLSNESSAAPEAPQSTRDTSDYGMATDQDGNAAALASIQEQDFATDSAELGFMGDHLGHAETASQPLPPLEDAFVGLPPVAAKARSLKRHQFQMPQ